MTILMLTYIWGKRYFKEVILAWIYFSVALKMTALMRVEFSLQQEPCCWLAFQ